ncbi:MAG: beta-ketoacyl-ACP synthase II [Rickettsiales bacterium]|jgi:3-oxoacyl-[acyl-carrier-protein] synthase II|nr:beta-ketoacyl-ACP synthase II [Rickettsiales bacterium]
MRRVVVTGLGLVSPLGNKVNSSWNNIINSKSGIRRIQSFDLTNIPDKVSKYAGEVNIGVGENDFNPDLFIEKKDQRKNGKFIWFALGAAEEALTDANWKPSDENELARTGVMIGSGIGGLDYIQNTCKSLFSGGITKISPFFIPASLINLATGHISIKYGFTGPNQAAVTACASGAHAIGDSARMIRDEVCDVVITGGAESSICELGIGGFSSMKALSTRYIDCPEKACRPWDSGRDGFVMGEAAGILVLEEYEHAKKRGAKIYTELVGYGSAGDAFHVTSPDPNGKGQISTMKMALKSAGITADKIGYINAHGTSTPIGDVCEFNSIKNIFGSCLDGVSVSSTKSATGHSLGAAGAVEAILCIKALNDGILPPTLNLENLDERCVGIDLVPLKAKEKKYDYVMSNSFGFGGTNASLIFKKI